MRDPGLDAVDRSNSADLQKDASGIASANAIASKDSYTIAIENLPVKLVGKYNFVFQYYYANSDQAQSTPVLGPPSATYSIELTIPDLSEAPTNVVAVGGVSSYSVSWDKATFASYGDTVVYESDTNVFDSNSKVVFIGTATQCTVIVSNYTPKYVYVVHRDMFKDANKKGTVAGPITIKTADPDTTFTVSNPTTSSAVASIDPKDLSGFSVVSQITWAQSSDPKTAGYAIRWSTDNPASVANPLWEYASVSGKENVSYTATGLIPNTTYYYQIASTTPYDVVSWTSSSSGTFIASDSDGTSVGALARLKSFIAIGGATQDLFKIGTGISESINLNTDPLLSPTLTSGTYHGIVLNKSTANVGNNFWLTTGQFRVGNPTEFMYWNGTNLYLTGNINATGGKFTGNVQMAIPAGSTTSGVLYAGSSPTTGQRVRFSSEGLFGYDSSGETFKLESSSGLMTASKGSIANWTLSGNTISKNNITLDSSGTILIGASNSNNTIRFSSSASASPDGKVYRMWIGSTTDYLAPFRIADDGTFYATAGVIGSNVTIGGSTVSTVVSNAANALQSNGTFTGTVSGTATINGVAASTVQAGAAAGATALQSFTIPSNYVTTSTSISGGQITTGTIKNGSFNGTADGAAFSTSGMAINLDNSSITSPFFTFNSSGASLKGKLSVGTPGDFGSSDFFQTSYSRNGVSVTGINGVAFESLLTSGWVTANYPYNDNDVDLGVNQYTYPSGPRAGQTAGPFRWRNLRLTGYLNIGGDGTTNTVSTAANNVGPKTQLQADGNIFANTLGLGSGTNLVQSGGYIRVSSSSRRYKENIEPINGSYLNSISMLQPVTFSYKPEFSKVDVNPITSGLIAEDVHEIEGLRSIVNYNENEEPESVSYDRLSVFLAMSIKELNSKIELLSNRLDALEA
jgi:hypothetical protein